VPLRRPRLLGTTRQAHDIRPRVLAPNFRQRLASGAATTAWNQREVGGGQATLVGRRRTETMREGDEAAGAAPPAQARSAGFTRRPPRSASDRMASIREVSGRPRYGLL